jgi:hypothetical protein
MAFELISLLAAYKSNSEPRWPQMFCRDIGLIPKQKSRQTQKPPNVPNAALIGSLHD